MKIKSIHAFAIRTDLAKTEFKTKARRPAWARDGEVAGPMSRYARFKPARSTWRTKWPAMGCVVTAEDGTWGFGIGRYGAPVIAVVNDHFAPLLIGENCMATDRIWDMMTRMAAPYGSTGLASYAISAVDLALWDLKGKLLKTPVYELAGGPAREYQTCYATGSDTDWNMELGFPGTKIPCPFGTSDGLAGIDKNEEVVAAVRELVGPKIEVMLDCWMAFDVEFAVRLAERLRPYNLKWFEDCLIPENLDAHDVLRRRLPWQTLATGEHWYTVYPFAHAAARQTVDIFQPDIAWVGGFTGCVRICHIAEAAGMAVILHAGMNTPFGQHLSFAMPSVPWGEYFVATPPGVPLIESVVFPGTATPVDGKLVPNDAPGFGMTMTLDDLEAMKV